VGEFFLIFFFKTLKNLIMNYFFLKKNFYSALFRNNWNFKKMPNF